MLEGWQVLVLEDEIDSLEVALTILTYHGATVYTATNGKEGLDLLKEKKPHFVISDLSMPVMDGWQFISEVKKDRTLAEIPVIALSAENFSESRNRAIIEGFHNFMSKPLTPETFVDDLLKLLVDHSELQALLNNLE